MYWNVLDQGDDAERQKLFADFERRHGFSFKRKSRFLVDESLGVGATKVMRDLKANVTDVWELGIIGHPDENVAAAARRERRIILTHDDDFLRERVYPLRQCHGVAIFPFADTASSTLAVMLMHFCFYSSWAGAMYQTKIKMREDWTWDMHYIGNGGRFERDQYRIEDADRVSILETGDEDDSNE